MGDSAFKASGRPGTAPPEAAFSFWSFAAQDGLSPSHTPRGRVAVRHPVGGDCSCSGANVGYRVRRGRKVQRQCSMRTR